MQRAIICICLSAAMIVSSSNAAKVQKTEYDIVRAKEALVRTYGDQYRKGYEKTIEGKIRNDQVEELICKMQANVIEESYACSELEKLGVYKLDYPEEEITPYATEPSNVDLNTPSIAYDSYDNSWIVCGGGWWPNDSDWQKDIPWLSVGTEANIGGYDGIGVKLYNTSGTYDTYVMESRLYYTDGEGNEYYGKNPSLFDGRAGTYFEYQDKVVANTNNQAGVSYVGKHFAVMIKYDSKFSKFNGYARTQYTHTWSSANISDVQFEANQDSPKFAVTIVNAAKSFTCYSTGEKKF